MAPLVYSNKYEIQKEIAQGGMGIVYQAWDRMLERVVALKVIHQHLVNDSNNLARFLDEARKMAHLHHPNIIQIYSVEEEQGQPFLVMEYFPGANLKTHLSQQDLLGLKESVNIVLQIAQALSFTHGKGIIHRDIKPANILLDNTMTVKLTDFGIARALGQTAFTVAGQILGTVKYMSPEQARDIPLDGRSDLYSLGMLFYELVTGANPRNDLTAVGILSLLITEGHVPPLNFPASLNIPNEIQRIIFDLLQFHPTDRIPNAETLRERLEKSFLENSAPMTTSEGRNTNETITLNVGHSLKGLPTQPPVSQRSDTLSPLIVPFQAIHGDSGPDNKGFFPSSQNPSSIETEPAQKNVSHSQGFSLLRIGLFGGILFLILGIGGYALNEMRDSQPDLPMEKQTVSKANIKKSKVGITTHLRPDTVHQTQEDKGGLADKVEVPIKTTTTSPPAPKRHVAKIPLDPPKRILSPQNPTEETSSMPSIVSETESSIPPPAKVLPREQSQSEQESQVELHPIEKLQSEEVIQAEPPSPEKPQPVQNGLEEPHFANVSSPELQSEESPSPPVSIASLAPSSGLAPSEVPPIVLEEPALPIEVIKESQSSRSLPTSQDLMRSNLHLQVTQLQQAIIEKNWDALERISSMSEARRSWLETLYKKYRSVKIDIAHIETKAREGQAIIHFSKGIRSNGEIVIPNKIGRTIKLTIPKNGNEWGRIIW